MTTPNRGVGKFTTQNLVAVLQAIPKSNGTYGGDVHPHTIAGWIQAGNANIRDSNNATAYARFAKIYRELFDIPEFAYVLDAPILERQ